MHRILFICHGNICRSPMAQFVMADLVKRSGRSGEFEIDSAATRRDELGSRPHRGTVRKLGEVGVPVLEHRARLVRPDEYRSWDVIAYMDDENERDLMRLFNGDPDGRCHRLLSFAGKNRDVADPWYTGNFDETYRDVVAGCQGLLESLES